MKTRIKKPLTALMMAWGTYLAIPCPYKVWDDALRPWQIVCLPPVGLIVGLSRIHISEPTRLS